MLPDAESDESIVTQLDDLLGSLEGLMSLPEVRPSWPLYVATDLLRRSRRQFGRLPPEKRRPAIARVLGRFYAKRADGMPPIILPDRIDEKIRGLLAQCREQ